MRNQWHAYIRSPNRGVTFFPVYGKSIQLALENAMDNLLPDEDIVGIYHVDMTKSIKAAEPYVQQALKL